MYETADPIYLLISQRCRNAIPASSGPLQLLTKSLQMAQNTAARILTKTSKFDHITLILPSLHWLPVHVRSDFKMHLEIPSYLSDLIKPYVLSHDLLEALVC